MAAAAVKAQTKTFYEVDTGTCQHVVWCPNTKKAAIIDSVLDFTPNDGATKPEAADEILDFVKEEGLDVVYVLETHAHADHITAAPYLKEKLGGSAKIGIGANITKVQGVFKTIYDLDDDTCKGDGSQFDVLFKEGDELAIGDLKFTVWHTPGHTPACVSYVISGDVIFTGDTIFLPDQGTARCDFPEGSVDDLWTSISRILALPGDTRLLTCHDYGPGGRAPAWETTVKDETDKNIHVKAGTERDQFVKWRNERDATLSAPRLIIPSVQANINAGYFPVDANGKTFLKTPVNTFAPPKDGADTGVRSLKK
jgi:glyoxylase-like metal-dependent hydrolase (beta-lactamase superfamily II)